MAGYWSAALRREFRANRQLRVILVVILFTLIQIQQPLFAALPSIPKNEQECRDTADSLGSIIKAFRGDDTDSEIKLEIEIWRHLCGRNPLSINTLKSLSPDIPFPTVTGLFIKLLATSTFFDLPNYAELSIEGVTIRGAVDLRDETLRSGLSIRDSVFMDPVYLSYLRSDRDLDFSGSTFMGGLTATYLQLNGSLYLGTGKQLPHNPAVSDLQTARHDERSRAATSNCRKLLGITQPTPFYYIYSIDLSKSQITGEVNISSVSSDDGLRLYSARVNKMVEITTSCLNSLEISYSNFGQFEFRGSNLGSDVTFLFPESGGAAVSHHTLPPLKNERYQFIAEGVTVDHSIFLDRSDFLDQIVITNSEIRGFLSLSGTVLRHVDLTGSRLTGGFRLGGSQVVSATNASPVKTNISLANTNELLINNDMVNNDALPVNIWRQDSLFSNANPRLKLDHAQVGQIMVPLRAWPRSIHLSDPHTLSMDDFRFDGIDVSAFKKQSVNNCERSKYYLVRVWKRWTGQKKEQRSTDAQTCYYDEWLRLAHYSPSLYRRVQEMLVRSGNEKQSKEIGFLGRDREREEAGPVDWTGLMLSSLFVGYGYETWRSALWAVAFIMLGSWLFTRSAAYVDPVRYLDGNELKNDSPASSDTLASRFNPIIFSFDLFLPLIEIRKKHYDLVIPERVIRGYFYFHRIMGYVLGSFIIGALFGVAK